MPNTPQKRIVLADFDNVIHDAFLGYGDGTIYGSPIPGANFTLRNLMDKYDVRIFTSRTKSEWPQMKLWLKANDLPLLEITNTKPKGMKALIDNRAIRFVSWVDVASYLL